MKYYRTRIVGLHKRAGVYAPGPKIAATDDAHAAQIVRSMRFELADQPHFETDAGMQIPKGFWERFKERFKA